MALKSAQQEPARAEVIEELLDELDKAVDRLKALYEQYFLGIQKQAPAYLHTDCERKIRELAQENIRNTALKYRFNMLQQKFGSYNSYWRRTLRQIENGTYLRQLSKVGRKAAQSGADIPDEILQAMPKRMREQVLKERAAALATAKRHAEEAGLGSDGLLELADEPAAFVGEPSILKRDLAAERRRDGAFLIDDDLDLDAFLRDAMSEAEASAAPKPAPPPPITAAPKPPPSRPATVAPPPIPPKRPPTVAPPPPPRATANDTIPNAPMPTPRALANDTIPNAPMPAPRPRTPSIAPSQQTRPNPIAPGATAQRAPTPPPVSAGGRAPASRNAPPGMSDGDVDALYQKYVAAKKMVGEDAGPAARDKLLRTIHAQAPKIMEQYKAKGVDFSIVVKDNQVIIKAKPKP